MVQKVNGVNRNMLVKVWKESIQDAMSVLEVERINDSNFGVVMGLASHISDSRIPTPVMLVEWRERSGQRERQLRQ